MKELYNIDPGFKIYVDRYCAKHDVTVDEALTHAVVIEVAKIYEEARNGC